MQGYILEDTIGPDSYEAGYWGGTEHYQTLWRNAAADTRISCFAWQYDNKHNARWAALNYASVKQRQGISARRTIMEHEQVFIPWIGDDFVAYKLYYLWDGVEHTRTSVRFLNAETNIVSFVSFFRVQQQ